MKQKQFELKNKLRQKDDSGDNLLGSRVKWNENGITHLGNVIEVNSVHGVKYLTVMTIFGKRQTVKLSKVKFQSAIA